MNNETQNYIGIDYGMGRSNIDTATGIRYGVISVNSLADWCAGEAEAIYPDKVDVQCPECRHSFETDITNGDDDQTCPECEHEFQERGLDFLEPIGHDYNLGSGEYQTDYSESLNAVFVTKSPFYTFAVYCSPCCPGALDLDHPITDGDGPKAYCFGHEMFDDAAPYRVFRVADGVEVLDAEVK